MIKTTIPYLLKRAAFKHPDKEAIVSEKGRWTYAQWEANANKRAQAFAGRGIKKGDRVATIFLNGNEVLETYLALMKLGAVIVPLNVRLAPGELQYIIEHSGASSIILSDEFESPIREIKDGLQNVKQYFMSGGDVQEDMIPLEEIYHGEPDKDPSEALDGDDTACILYTAGTTGRPKGVLLSHRNCVWGAVNIAFNVNLEPEYRVLLVFPLYHAAAFIILIGNLFLGCTNVILKTFDPRRVMELIGEEKINRMTFPPTVWNFILQLPDLEKYDTMSVRAISSGAESMPLETKKKLLDLFPNGALGETYGMTESSTDAIFRMTSFGSSVVMVADDSVIP